MEPKIEQLIDTIKNGDDTRHNSLILNLDGTFEIPEEISLDIKKEYIIRFETFVADNNYVGFNASEDKKFIDRIYKKALEAWNDYQKNNKCKNQYTDFF